MFVIPITSAPQASRYIFDSATDEEIAGLPWARWCPRSCTVTPRLRRLEARRPEPRAGRVGDAHMGDEPRAEERLLPRDSAIDELVDDHEMPRRVFLAERPAEPRR